MLFKKIAAWLYIINAAMLLSSVTFAPFGIGGSGNAAVLMMAGLYGGMGVGLLQQKVWARWLALGSSFLGWTIGGLLIILCLGYLVIGVGLGTALGFLTGGGWMAFIGAIVLFCLLFWVVGVIISFKLFFYLCSEEGCEEFEVPYGSAGTVAASVAAWIGIFIVNGMMSGGPSLTSLAAMSLGSKHEDSAREQRVREESQWREQYERAERRRKEAAERARKEAERARAAEAEARYAAATQAQESPVDNAAIERLPAESYPSVSGSRQADEDKPSATRILKCRDASGGITFTQGYCPAGTKQVEMPASE